jgi:Sulfotransferase family
MSHPALDDPLPTPLSPELEPPLPAPAPAGAAPPGAAAPEPLAPPPPIFVGGTGRSGTTVVGRLLGRQRDHTVIPVEARFHCSPDGLPSVLRGRQTPEEFAQRVLTEWFHPPGGAARLATFVERAPLEAALARFLARAPEDTPAAARELIEGLFGDYARSQGRRGWVEMTPINAMWGAPYLAAIFPRLRFVNVVRDGRDVAGSLIRVGWATDARAALAWWEERMLRGHRQLALLPARSLLTVRFERLLVEDREGGLAELLSFMGWEEDPLMRRFFTRRMPASEAHVGRWRSDFSGRERELLASEYEAALARLHAAGAITP